MRKWVKWVNTYSILRATQAILIKDTAISDLIKDTAISDLKDTIAPPPPP